jgi:mannosyltransferase
MVSEFYDIEELKRYKWYWRIEPEVEFSCSITYDPFVEMVRHGKVYGYTIALWEKQNTAPNLFQLVSDYKRERLITDSTLWMSMISPAWLPWPFRKMLRFKEGHDITGDSWNLCHYWSNFEIADMDFFRSAKYRDFFKYLDEKEGFYLERVSPIFLTHLATSYNADMIFKWGDAAVHSLAAALFLEPDQLHNFEDFGYRHPPFGVCPANARAKQLPDIETLHNPNSTWTDETDDGIGCRCTCEAGQNFPSYCLNQLQRGIRPLPS